MWDVDGGELLATLEVRDTSVRGLAFSPDGLWLAGAGSDRAVKVWDARTGALRVSLPGHTADVASLAFTPDGERLASGDADGVLKVWDAGTGADLLTLAAHKGGILSLVFSPDGTRLASGDAGGTLKVWEGRWEAPRDEAARQERDREDLAWHRRQARAAEEAGDGFAARFHLERLSRRGRDRSPAATP